MPIARASGSGTHVQLYRRRWTVCTAARGIHPELQSHPRLLLYRRGTTRCPCLHVPCGIALYFFVYVAHVFMCHAALHCIALHVRHVPTRSVRGLRAVSALDLYCDWGLNNCIRCIMFVID